MPERSLGVRWNVARKAVGEIPVASSRPKRRAFDASTLRLLEELCESTWAIVQDRHPFRDPTKTMNSGTNFGGNFLSSLRILTSRISMACSDQYWRPSRGALTTKWRA